MQTASDELRHFARQRSGVLLELAACAVAGAALWQISDRLAGSLPEAEVSFLAAALLFGLGLVRLVAQALPVLAFRCPRCDQLFHADGSRAVVRLRACAHCGLSVPGPATGATDASSGA